ncbi:hypothetical protein [Campylobacter iguaniorum]|uniref:hypothetical protein n=1 Tax=Campylobacter iguaniorum TaxID=1244531 RepID=UPI000A8E2100|nr:hypothetical protein [Campylobacter iguaniorum]
MKKFYANLNAKFATKHKNRFLNFYEFSNSLTDKIAVWLGKIKFDDLILDNERELNKLFFSGGSGKVVIVSHFGNIEIARALSSHAKGLKMAILVYDKNSANFTNIINSLSKTNIKTFKVDELDISSMLEISNFIDGGGFICVMGDRTPLNGNKTTQVKFLGKMADFPQGGFAIASILKCDIWALWCIKIKGKYHLKADFLANDVNRRKIGSYIQIYADLLAQNCKSYPQMWFNFFDYWGKNEKL